MMHLGLRMRVPLESGIYKSYKLPDILFIFSSKHAINNFLSELLVTIGKRKQKETINIQIMENEL